jgi:hypothetical protein
MNYVLDPLCGSTFDSVANEAKTLSTHNGYIVEFEFNGCKCLVNSDTNLDLLYRDYCNRYDLGWNSVGPDCMLEYTDLIKDTLDIKREISLNESKKREIEYKNKEKKSREIFQEKVGDIKMEFSSESDWNLGKANNTDGYGAAIFEYAEGWAKLMQAELANGKSLADVASKTSFEMDFMGISGFMYGAALQTLVQCWVHGKELNEVLGENN